MGELIPIESAQLLPATVYAAWQGPATINDSRYFLESTGLEHNVEGHGVSTRFGRVQIRLAGDDRATFLIEGVALIQKGPCTLSPASIGKAFIANVDGTLEIELACGAMVKIGDKQLHKTLIKADFMIPRPLDKPTELTVPFGPVAIAGEDLRHRLNKKAQQTAAEGPDLREHLGRMDRPRAPGQVKSVVVVPEKVTGPPIPMDSEPADSRPPISSPHGSDGRRRRERTPSPFKRNVRQRLSERADEFVTSVYEDKRSEYQAVLLRPGLIRNQLAPVAAAGDQVDEDLDQLALDLENEIVTAAGFRTLRRLHCATGHSPEFTLRTYRNGRYKLILPKEAKSVDCRTCFERRVPTSIRPENVRFERAYEAGQVINISAIEDAKGQYRVLVISDEYTGWMRSFPFTSRGRRGPEQFVDSIRQFYSWLAAVSPSLPSDRFIRCRVYSDRCYEFRTYLDKAKIQLLTDQVPVVYLPGVGPVGQIEFLRFRRSHLAAASVSSDETIEQEVAYICHMHNNISYNHEASAFLRFSGRVDDRLWFGYREAVVAEVNGVNVTCLFIGYSGLEFGYLVEHNGKVIHVYVIERSEPL